jgi:predicted RND superfamily exporter protein
MEELDRDMVYLVGLFIVLMILLFTVISRRL